MDQPITRLLLIRHGHVDTGPAPGRLCGWFDVPLSAKGRAQLLTLRERPFGLDAPEALYSSTLTRARDVAAVLADVWRLQDHALDSLREIHCGRLDGMPIHDITCQYPELWARNHAQLDDDFRWPEGESYREFRQRVFAALSGIASRHAGRRVAVVTHAGVVAQVVGAIKGRPPAVWEPDRPAPLTATEVTWSNGGPEAVLTFGLREWR